MNTAKSLWKLSLPFKLVNTKYIWVIPLVLLHLSWFSFVSCCCISQNSTSHWGWVLNLNYLVLKSLISWIEFFPFLGIVFLIFINQFYYMRDYPILACTINSHYRVNLRYGKVKLVRVDESSSLLSSVIVNVWRNG